MGRLLDSSNRDRHLLPADRTVDVFFHDYMADEIGTMQRIYDAAGIEFTDEAKAEVAAYQAAHPRGKEGRVVYNLRGDFGVAPEDVRSRYTNYMSTFPVQIEVQ
jgi:hypothetical protein